jgi:hypothetical protein
VLRDWGWFYIGRRLTGSLSTVAQPGQAAYLSLFFSDCDITPLATGSMLLGAGAGVGVVRSTTAGLSLTADMFYCDQSSMSFVVGDAVVGSGGGDERRAEHDSAPRRRVCEARSHMTLSVPELTRPQPFAHFRVCNPIPRLVDTHAAKSSTSFSNKKSLARVLRDNCSCQPRVSTKSSIPPHTPKLHTANVFLSHISTALLCLLIVTSIRVPRYPFTTTSTSSSTSSHFYHDR